MKMHDYISGFVGAAAMCLFFGFVTQIAYNAIFVNFLNFENRMPYEVGISIWLFIVQGVLVKTLFFGERKPSVSYHFHETLGGESGAAK